MSFPDYSHPYRRTLAVEVWPFAEFLAELQSEIHWALLRQHLVEPNRFTEVSLGLAYSRVRECGKQPR